MRQSSAVGLRAARGSKSGGREGSGTGQLIGRQVSKATVQGTQYESEALLNKSEFQLG